MVENTIEEKEVMLSDEALVVINRDLVSFVETLKDLVGQLEPQVKSLSKELSPRLNAIKASLDKDETFVLAERLAENTGTLLELVTMLESMNDLRKELEPQIKKLAAEASPVISGIKANLDKGETLVLLERLSVNTGTLLELVSYLEALKDLTAQLEPQLKSLSKEFGPRLNSIKANLDRDETFLLAEKLTANTGTFLEMMSYLEALNDLKNELEPKLKALMKETSPVLSSIKANLDRDETLLLVERLTSNTGTLLELISIFEGLDDLRKEIEPQIKAIAKEVSPTVNAVRSFLENERTVELAKRSFNSIQELVEDDEVLGLIERAPSLKKPILQFADCMCEKTDTCDGAPTRAEASIESLLKLTEIASSPVIQSLVNTTAEAVKEANTADIKPVSMFGLMTAFRDKDVQRATGFLVYFLKKLGQGLNSQPK